MVTTTEKLFEPIKVGNVTLQHRVAMAPLTRYRADRAHVHHDIAATYYAQRSSTPGTLIVTEATFISPKAAGYRNVPGIWSKEQIKGWKKVLSFVPHPRQSIFTVYSLSSKIIKVTKAVHKNKSSIFIQLWALGRTAKPEVLAEESGDVVVAPSPIPISKTSVVPKELTVEEIKSYIDDYTQAAKNAIEAGFDGVELHGANGEFVIEIVIWRENDVIDAYQL
jgi:2,4-dienoyl-CoA reductase-like NADH-dependent reductase (Old Yellow Enzyme family)